jgi:hypothetical protein
MYRFGSGRMNRSRKETNALEEDEQMEEISPWIFEILHFRKSSSKDWLIVSREMACSRKGIASL